MITFITVYLLSFTVVLYIASLFIKKMRDLKEYLIIIIYYLVGVSAILSMTHESIYIKLLGLCMGIYLIYHVFTQSYEEKDNENN